MNRGAFSTSDSGLCILYLANCSYNRIMCTRRNRGTVANSLEAKALDVCGSGFSQRPTFGRELGIL